MQPEGRREPPRTAMAVSPTLAPPPQLFVSQSGSEKAPFKPSLVPWTWVAAASVPGVLDPVANHPLLARAPLDHQPQAKVGLLGHLHLQAAAGIAADDRTVLPQRKGAGLDFPIGQRWSLMTSFPNGLIPLY